MIVICNSSRQFCADRLAHGDAFVFGKTRMLLRADYIVLTDKNNSIYVIRKSDVVWAPELTGATHVIKIRAFAQIKPFELNAACPQFNSRVFGTIAFRNPHFEYRLNGLKYVETIFGGLHGTVSCV
ncbi:hypothetical protein MPK67_gp292 [Erwinia phage pEa_SNUABM_32]|uniref:Uncharacterized protein n=1 Tax=Erwinia phage pEa_SNUABM_32 TaxID=2869555 RepID=A0AAE7XKE6_9CAUD|nr:hypothetical protein MPK67_gp292 [Erwinia phage pEa_SNUABM_32]QZE57165.1 hypothetical protein pEaSNUABM32_00292 [Erwinia phage pEa_SNUABM_32]